MPTRSCLIVLHNETTEPLTRVGYDVTAGRWRAGGTVPPPETVPPHSTVEMGSGSHGIATGTEASVRYRIGTDPGAYLSMRWNNPFVGSNEYHYETDSGHHAFYKGGAGNNAIAHYFLRPSRLTSTGFVPSAHGFKFPNSFGDVPYTLPVLRDSALNQKYGNAANGLCGGMVFGALDYFQSGYAIPATTTPPAGEQDPLFLYLVDRLFATYQPDTITLLLRMMNQLTPDRDSEPLGWDDLGTGGLRRLLGSRASIIVDTEWPMIRDDIDAGRPSPLVLCRVRSIMPSDLGKNHQVLAYAYEVRGFDVQLWIYDPNFPGAEVWLKFNISSTDRIVTIDTNDPDGKRPNCFARLPYVALEPPGPHEPRRGANNPRFPPQVLLDATVDLGGGVLVDSGHREFAVLGGECGYRPFHFERVRQHVRFDLTARPVSYDRPVLSWAVNDVDVPAGGPHQLEVTALRVEASPLPALEEEEPVELPDAVPATVHLRTTTEGATLTIRNEPNDGNYGLTVTVRCVEEGAAPGSATYGSRQLSVRGERLDVPGLAQASQQCFSQMLDGLRQEVASEEALIASILLAVQHPPDPLWDPDPLSADAGWEALVEDPIRVEVEQDLAEAPTILDDSVLDVAERAGWNEPASAEAEAEMTTLPDDLELGGGNFRG